jgi:hypothetical protein
MEPGFVAGLVLPVLHQPHDEASAHELALASALRAQTLQRGGAHSSAPQYMTENQQILAARPSGDDAGDDDAGGSSAGEAAVLLTLSTSAVLPRRLAAP